MDAGGGGIDSAAFGAAAGYNGGNNHEGSIPVTSGGCGGGGGRGGADHVGGCSRDALQRPSPRPSPSPLPYIGPNAPPTPNRLPVYKIQFPKGYVPTRGQETLMSHVLRGLDRGENALLDCPTGNAVTAQSLAGGQGLDVCMPLPCKHAKARRWICGYGEGKVMVASIWGGEAKVWWCRCLFFQTSGSSSSILAPAV